MNKRDFLKVAPVAAMAAATVSVSGIETQAFELKQNKKYIIVLPEAAVISHAELERMGQLVRSRGIDATVIMNVDGLQIYELV